MTDKAPPCDLSRLPLFDEPLVVVLPDGSEWWGASDGRRVVEAHHALLAEQKGTVERLTSFVRRIAEGNWFENFSVPETKGVVTGKDIVTLDLLLQSIREEALTTLEGSTLRETGD